MTKDLRARDEEKKRQERDAARNGGGGATAFLGNKRVQRKPIPAWAKSSSAPPSMEQRVRDEAQRRWRKLGPVGQAQFQEMAARKKQQHARDLVLLAARQ